MATQASGPRPQRQPQRPVQRQAQQQRTSRKVDAKGMVRPFEMPFERKNLVIILAGIATVGLGYLIMGMSPTMSFAALTLAPIILILGYCIIIPMGIMSGARKYIRDKRQAESRDEALSASERSAAAL
jgi:Flp pilus assembly protein TadB